MLRVGRQQLEALNPRSQKLRLAGWLCSALAGILLLAGCNAEIRKSDAELGLNEQQSAGRRIYDRHCDQCHEPYSTSGKKGPGFKGIFKKQDLSERPARQRRARRRNHQVRPQQDARLRTDPRPAADPGSAGLHAHSLVRTCGADTPAPLLIPNQ